MTRGVALTSTDHAACVPVGFAEKKTTATAVSETSAVAVKPEVRSGRATPTY